MKRFVVAAAVAAVLMGCASVPRASAERDIAAKRFDAAPSGKANLYVFRDETYGGNWGATVLLDGKLLGQTTHHTYLLAQVAPGPHTLVSQAENDTGMSFVAEAGRNHFVWQEMKAGVWRARAILHEVDEQRGRSGVSRCQLVQSQ